MLGSLETQCVVFEQIEIRDMIRSTDDRVEYCYTLDEGCVGAHPFNSVHRFRFFLPLFEFLPAPKKNENLTLCC